MPLSETWIDNGPDDPVWQVLCSKVVVFGLFFFFNLNKALSLIPSFPQPVRDRIMCLPVLSLTPKHKQQPTYELENLDSGKLWIRLDAGKRKDYILLLNTIFVHLY